MQTPIKMELTDNMKFNIRFASEDCIVANDFTESLLQLKRYYIKDNRKFASESMNKLSETILSEGSDINTLGMFLTTNPKGDIVVEVPLYLNYINVYSLYDTSLAKTICIGEDLVEVQSIEKLKFNEKDSYFKGVTAFDEFFGVSYIKARLEQFNNDEIIPTEIMFFDWKGKTLKSIVVNEKYNFFTMDKKREKLYTVNYGTEEVREYDVKSIFSN